MKYLEKINRLLEYTKKEKYQADFFDSNLTQDQIDFFYKLGYWDHILLGYDNTLRVFIAIRIVSHLSPEKWPIVYIERNINSVLMCSNLGALPMLGMQRLVGSKGLFESFYEEVEEIKEICKPVYKDLDCLKSYNIYMDYIGDLSNIPKERKEFNSLEEKKKAQTIQYLKIYKKFDDSEGFNLFVDLVGKMKEDKHCLPEIPTKNYGVWTTRIYKMIARRAYFRTSEVNLDTGLVSMWRSFIEPHSYDPQTSPDYYPENSTDTNNFYNKILDMICESNKEDFPEEIKEHPLFEVALNMRNSEISNSLGFATAAAVIDEQYDDPALVWKTLINASFYTSSVEQHVLLAKQAKALCERNGWKDAALAVGKNIEIYEKMS